MPHRYTIKELEEWNDYEMLLHLVRDRQEAVTNTYTPFNQRLNKLMKSLEKKKLSDRNICSECGRKLVYCICS